MTELRIESYEIPAADLGPENPLPFFRSASENSPFKTDSTVPEEDCRYLGWQTGDRVLPYRMQDGYNRDKKPRAFKAIVLENEHLRAIFLPELGGRLASLIYKQWDRELLDRNPVFQPCNLAQRNAWISGGIEWNTSHFGHYYLTCSPVFAAEVIGPDNEPVLRIYEWDRVQAFPWQIDFHLPSGSRFLFSRVRIVNPHEVEIPMYWWTNMAVEEKPDVRVLVPAETAIHPVDGGFGVMDLPMLKDNDCTYTTRVPHAHEFFFRIPENRRRWISALDGEGKGFVQTSTDRLRGRKLFCWGNCPGGRHWQEFLAEPGRAYLEIQAGLARTQLESVPMSALAEWTWTEAFGPLQADPGKVHSQDWDEAWRAAESALESALPRERLQKLDAKFSNTTTQAPAEALAIGSGWAVLERRRMAKTGEPDRIPPELIFEDSTLGPDQQPWLALLELGALPESDPDDDPGQLMAQPEWRSLLESALSAGRGDHWLSWYHLGNMRMEAHDTDGAREAWEASIKRRENGWSIRNLAVIETRAGNNDLACELMQRAWEVNPRIAQIAVEYAQALLQSGRYEAVMGLISGLPEDIRNHERIVLAAAKAGLETGDYEKVEALFGRELVTVREGEVSQTELWFSMHERKIAAAEGIEINDELKQRVRRDFPPPASIDYRMA